MIVPIRKYKVTLKVKYPNNKQKVVELIKRALIIRRGPLQQRVVCEENSIKRLRFLK